MARKKQTTRPTRKELDALNTAYFGNTRKPANRTPLQAFAVYEVTDGRRIVESYSTQEEASRVCELMNATWPGQPFRVRTMYYRNASCD